MANPDPRVQMARQMAQDAQTRAVRGARIGMIVGGTIFLIVAAVAVVLFALIPAARLVFGILAPAFLGGGILFLYVARRFADPTRLRTEGIAGVAKLIGVTGGGMAIKTHGSRFAQSVLQLEVSVDGRAPYTVNHRSFLPIGAISRLVPGASFPVKVDRKDPQVLLVEWDEG